MSGLVAAASGETAGQGPAPACQGSDAPQLPGANLPGPHPQSSAVRSPSPERPSELLTFLGLSHLLVGGWGEGGGDGLLESTASTGRKISRRPEPRRTPQPLQGPMLSRPPKLPMGPLPVPPKPCMSICSSRYMRQVLTWGRRPRRKTNGKHKVNTGREGGQRPGQSARAPPLGLPASGPHSPGPQHRPISPVATSRAQKKKEAEKSVRPYRETGGKGWAEPRASSSQMRRQQMQK